MLEILFENVKNVVSYTSKISLVVFSLFISLPAQQAGIVRKMAVTFDDLPMVRPEDNADMRENTNKIIAALKAHTIPAIGFVNAVKLERNGKLDNERVDILNLWLENGMLLGNHTYSHPSYHSVKPEEYFQNIILGETPIKEMIRKTGDSLRYFRHPFLHTGRSIGSKDSLNLFLQSRGYTVAPVTIDNAEWIFAQAYDNAWKAGDPLLAVRIGEVYIDYMIEKIKFFEGNSQSLFGRNIAHILLVHANKLNADYFDALAGRIETLGYTFITLDAVLKDPAYGSVDTFTGRGGISWLHRWAISAKKGKEFFRGEPTCSKFVLEAAGVDEE